MIKIRTEPVVPIDPERVSVWDVILTVILTAVMVAFGIVLTFLAAVESMVVDACGPSHLCNFDLLSAAQFLIPIAGVIALVGTIVLAIVFGRRGIAPAWAPCVGGALIFLAFVLASILINVSTA